MAGSNPSFDRQAFLDGIRFAMQMGTPEDTRERLIFYFRTAVYYPPDTRLDQQGRPLDPTVRSVRIEPDPVEVLCAYEISQASADETPVGSFRPSKLTVTLLPDEFEQVRNAIEIGIAGDRYVITYRPPSYGLFDVTVYQLVAFAREET